MSSAKCFFAAVIYGVLVQGTPIRHIQLHSLTEKTKNTSKQAYGCCSALKAQQDLVSGRSKLKPR